MSESGLFVWANLVEACWWGLLGLVAGWRLRRWWLAGVLVAFGASDLVEMQTGAWWRPWWLLVWKATCVMCITAIGISLLRRRKTLARAAKPDARPVRTRVE